MKELAQREFCKNVAPHFQFANLDSLKPSSESILSLDKQAGVIAYMKTHPSQGYAFAGPAGTGKTTFSVALYREAIDTEWVRFQDYSPELEWTARHKWHRRYGQGPVWRIAAKTLMDEFHARAMSREDESGKPAPEPTVTRKRILEMRAHGFRPSLCLEEIDKIHWSEFKNNALFEVIDGLYENDGQLVLNTNLRMNEFFAQFGGVAEPLARRIGSMCKVYDFFGGK
jgi:DNA polymerase III delta prime subunit